VNLVGNLRKVEFTLIRQENFGCHVLAHVIKYHDLYPYDLSSYYRVRQVHRHEEGPKYFQLKAERRQASVVILIFVIFARERGGKKEWIYANTRGRV